MWIHWIGWFGSSVDDKKGQRALLVLGNIQICNNFATSKAELQNVTVMPDISVYEYWKVGVKSVGKHAVLLNYIVLWDFHFDIDI